MDYEKAFKEAYERASLRFGTNVANELFLEYKESKEERTRRKLIEFFSDWSKTKSHCWGIRVTDIMDWLEKQGQKPAEWSEEDELHIRELESLVKQVWTIAEHENDKDNIHKMSDLSFFLKTLKPQLKQEWKPTKEQMYMLEWLTTNVLDDGVVGNKAKEVLYTLIEQLKSIKQRIKGE